MKGINKTNVLLQRCNGDVNGCVVIKLLLLMDEASIFISDSPQTQSQIKDICYHFRQSYQKPGFEFVKSRFSLPNNTRDIAKNESSLRKLEFPLNLRNIRKK